MLGIIQIGDYLKYLSPKISMLVLTRLKVKAIMVYAKIYGYYQAK